MDDEEKKEKKIHDDNLKKKNKKKLKNKNEINYIKKKKNLYENDSNNNNLKNEIFYKDTNNFELQVNMIDAHWLQRKLNEIFSDPSISLEKEKEILKILKIYDIQECENKLVNILKYENFNMAKLLIKNKWKVYYCTLLGQVQTEKEKKNIIEEMKKTKEGEEILKELNNFNDVKKYKESEFAKTMRKEADNLFNKKIYKNDKGNDLINNKRIIYDEDEENHKKRNNRNFYEHHERLKDESTKYSEGLHSDKHTNEITSDLNSNVYSDKDTNLDSDSDADSDSDSNSNSLDLEDNSNKKENDVDDNLKKKKNEVEKKQKDKGNKYEKKTEEIKAKYIDLEKIEIKEKYTDFLSKEVILPNDSKRIEKKEYDEIIINTMSDINNTKDNKKKRINYFTIHDQIKLISINELPEWSQEVFTCVNINKLNAVQSKVFETAFYKYEENMLICSPTGSGKTNIALLCILNVINNYILKSGNIDNNFKIIYISPMKALVNEQVQSFNIRLKSLNIKVAELTGDTNLSSKELEENQIIVMTPEKFEIISRKWNEKILLEKIRLIIFDEIHLLNETRGNVLESIISRINRYIDNNMIYSINNNNNNNVNDNINEKNNELENTKLKNEINKYNINKKKIRLVGLSATLPNYEDVGIFLKADLKKGVFYFDYSFRPVKLIQHYIGIKEKKGIKKYNLMNELTYEKVLEEAGKNQILIFVHSRKETYKTAKILIDKFLKSDNLNKFLVNKQISTQILLSEKDAIVNEQLKEILPYGFAIHHAGLKKTDRKLVEDLFSDKHIQVLISTSTLAWGINLPAHTVIIKGTSVYNMNICDFDELSTMDVLQMVGRAGRPQYDITGKAIIITDHKNLQLYLSLNNEQLCIESCLLNNIINILNAEIVLKNINNLNEGIEWFEYTYLYIRMIRNPLLYGIDISKFKDNPDFLKNKDNYKLLMNKINKKIKDIIYSCFVILEKYDLIKYDRKLNTVISTYTGKFSSYYYIDYKSIDLYNKKLNKHTNEIELLKIFSLSEEFKNIYIRPEEKVELSIFMEKLPIPIKESIDIPFTKVIILLQIYLSNVQLNGYIINADMVYIQQNALRIFRCFFELSLKKGCFQLTSLTLKFCKMIERRMWSSMTPLRQFEILSNELIKIIEKKNISFKSYLSMNLNEYTSIFKNKKIAKNIYKLVHHFPKIELNAYIQPINHKMLKVELNIIPDFIYNPKYHGYFMLFWVFVFDISNENILHYDLFTLKKTFQSSLILDQKKKKKKEIYSDSLDEETLTFYLPINDNPFYIIKVISDKWLECENTINLNLTNLILPPSTFYSTQLLDLQPLPVYSLKYELAKNFYLKRKMKYFNAVNTQIFSSVYENNGNVIICNSSFKYYLIPAELAIIRIIKFLNELNIYIKKNVKKETEFLKIVKEKKTGEIIYNKPLDLMKIVYIAPLEDIVIRTYKNWIELKNVFNLKMCMLKGDIEMDMKLLQKNNIILCTPDKYDNIFKKWRRKKILQNINLYIFDHIELLDTKNGAIMEILISKIRYISTQLQLNRVQNKEEKDENNTNENILEDIYNFIYSDDENNFINFINKMQKFNSNFIYDIIGINRILCLSTCSLYNCKDFSDWINCKKNDYFNFLSSVRNIPIEIYLNAVNIMNKENRYISMQRQIYQNLKKLKKKKNNAIIFVTEKKMCKLVAIDLILSAYNDNYNFYSAFKNTKKQYKRDEDINQIINEFNNTNFNNEKYNKEQFNNENFNYENFNNENLNNETLFDYISDKMLIELIKKGICYIHNNMNDIEKKIIEMLFEKKAVQILIVCYDYVYSLNVYANTVVVLDTLIENFNKKEENYSIQTMLEMISFAGRENEDNKAYAYIYTYITKKEYYKNFIYEPLTVESNIEEILPNFLNNEIVMSTIEKFQDAIDWLTWTFFYRRIKKNPNYYGLKGITNDHISDYLSELIENTIEILSYSNCIFVDEQKMELKPCNMGIISSFYNIDYYTIQFFNQYILSLTNLKKSKIFEIICLSNIFNDILKIDFYDIYLCIKIAKHCNIDISYEFVKLSLSSENILKNTEEDNMSENHSTEENVSNKLNEEKLREQNINISNFLYAPSNFTCNMKALIILHAHINRYKIPISYIEETKKILFKAFILINSLIDVISSNNILNFCLFTMEVSQILTQSIKTTEDSNFYQLPYFDKKLIEKANSMNLFDIYDLINCEDDVREELLKDLSEEQKSKIANVCNIFPIIEVEYEIDLNKKYKVNEIVQIQLNIQRDLTEDNIPFVHSPFLPFEKQEMWWIVIGIKKLNLLLAIKKISLLQQINNVKINFELPEKPQIYDIVIYIINDSYIGCDQEYTFKIHVENEQHEENY